MTKPILEYRIEHLPSMTGNTEKFVNAINELSKERWEPVYIEKKTDWGVSYLILFKRQKNDDTL